jgi:Secretion system C-terminal sorting domain
VIKREIIISTTLLALICQQGFSQNWLSLNGGIYCDQGSSGVPVVRDMFADNETNNLYLSGNSLSDGALDSCETETSVAAVWNGNRLITLNGSRLPFLVGGGRIAKYKDEIYVSTPVFSTVFETHFLSRWNGADWDSLPGAPDYIVATSKIINDELWLGGIFSQCGGVESQMLCKFDGVNFYPISIGNVEAADFVSGIDYLRDTLFIAGYFVDFKENGDIISAFAKFYNDELHLIEPAFDIFTLINFNCLVNYKDELYIGGNMQFSGQDTIHYLLKYDGEKFSKVGSDSMQMNREVVCMKIYNNELYILGSFDKLGEQEAHHLVKWDGEKYTILNTDTFFSKSGTPLQQSSNRLQTFEILNDTLYVGGTFYRIGQDTMQNIAKLNRALSDPIPPPAENSLTLYPNPSSNEVTIGYSLSSLQNVDFGIYDIRGRLVRKIEKSKKQAGKYVLKVDISNLANGIYIVQMRTGEGGIFKKLLKE